MCDSGAGETPVGGKQSVFFSCNPDAEVLNATTAGEAILEHLESLDPEHWPLEVKVQRYVLKDARYALEPGEIVDWMLARLDDGFGNPFDEYDGDLAPLVEAAERFMEEFAKHYVPWQCEEAESFTTNVEAWVQVNKPNWQGSLELARACWEKGRGR